MLGDSEYIDALEEEIDDIEGDDDGDGDDLIGELEEVGALTEVGARTARSKRGRDLAKFLKRKMKRARRGGMWGRPSPAFGRSERSTERRAPLGFLEDGSSAFFFTALAGGTTTMRGKVSRAAHPDRLLIVPSAPGMVIGSIKVGDEEQLLAPGAPVELYSEAALTDAVPDNFSPIGPALDFDVVLVNTTAGDITGTIGIKASVKR